MASVLIFLYAIDGTIAVPRGCFIAAWVLLGLKIAASAFEQIAKPKN